MGKKNRHRQSSGNARAAVMEPPASTVAQSAESGTAYAPGFGGNYAGAGYSPSRGQLTWNTLNTRYDQNPAERRELVRRSRALIANSGIARVIRTIAMMVGSQTPQMASGSDKWNTLAEQLLRFENGSAMISDAAGVHNLESVQELLEYLAMRDGDVFAVLTKTRTGRASWKIYEGHVVNGQPPGTYNDDNWRDGIKYNEDGRPVSFWFEDQSMRGFGRGQEVSASAVIHYQYEEEPGKRGNPALTHAINHIVDIIERRGYTKAGMKLRAMLGLAIETDSAGKAPQGNMPIQGMLKVSSGSRAGQVANASDPGPKFEEIDAGGNTAVVATLQPGQTVKSLSDDSPSPNASEFEAELLRDVAIGLQLPPQVIFWLEKQTGPMVRFTVGMAEKRIAQRRACMRNTFLNRWIAYQLSVALKTGNLTEPAGGLPDKWYACTWQEPAKLTIDVGRNGDLEIRQVDAGITSLHDVCGSQGQDWEETMAKKDEEARRILKLATELHKDFPEISLPQCLAMFRQQGRSVDTAAVETKAEAAPAEPPPAE